DALNGLADSDSAFVKALKAAERPAIVVGQGALTDAATLAAVAGLAAALGVVREGWNGWNVLHTAAARVGGLDLGFVPGEGGKSAVELVQKGGADGLFLMGADEIAPPAPAALPTYPRTPRHPAA